MRRAYCDYCDEVITEDSLDKTLKLDDLHFCSDKCLRDYIDQHTEVMSVYDLTEYGEEKEGE